MGHINRIPLCRITAAVQQLYRCLFLAMMLLVTPLLLPHSGSAQGLDLSDANVPTGGNGLFIENVGQFNPRVRFQLYGNSQPGVQSVEITDDGLWLTVVDQPNSVTVSAPATTAPEHVMVPSQPVAQRMAPQIGADSGTAAAHTGTRLHLTYVDANRDAQLIPFARRATSVNYFYGNDPTAWQTDVPVWGGVRVQNLYPGVDLLVTLRENQLHQQLFIQPGTATAPLPTIQFQVAGALDLATDAERIFVTTATGGFILVRPQMIMADKREGSVVGTESSIGNGSPIAVVSESGVSASSLNASSLTVPALPDQKTSIDTTTPFTNTTLLYSTFLGGGDDDQAFDLATDTGGNLYVAGRAASSDFPTTVGTVTLAGDGDGFIAKINPAGNGAADLLYATFIGGMDDESALALAVNAAGEASVIGTTASPDFPTTAGAYQRILRGPTDATIVTLSATGNALRYATYLGGNGDESGAALQISGDGQLIVAGATNSTDFPLTSGAIQSQLSQGESTFSDLFLTRLQGAELGNAELTYGTYLGGERKEFALALTLDDTDAIYLAGKTDSAAFPVTEGAFDTSYNGVAEFLYDDAFATKVTIAEDGQGQMIYSTYLGGNDSDDARAIAVDEGGALYLTGQTISANFPTTPSAYDTSYNGGTSGTGGDAYVAKLTPDGSRLDFATYLGGSWYELGHDLAVDDRGQIYFVGETNSGDFPVTITAWDPSYTTTALRYYDAFLVRLAPDGTSLTYATYLGDAGVDIAGALTLEQNDTVALAGWTSSARFPTTPGALAPGYHDDSFFFDPYDAFLTRFQLPAAAGLRYRVGGRIVDENGLPMANIRVDVQNSAGTINRFAASDANGFWAVPTLPAERYQIVPAQDGFLFQPISRTVTTPPNVVALDFVATPDNSGGVKPPLLIVHGNQSFSTNTFTCLTMPERYLGERQRSTLGDLPDWFYADGDYDTYLARLDSGPAYTASIDANALCLFQQIDALYDAHRSNGGSGQKVTIIAHSMGGLVARACLAYEGCRNKVRALYTLGTPHGGLNYNFLLRLYLATNWQIAEEGICRQQAPLCQFATDEMIFFNLYTPNQDGIHYGFIGGDANPLFPGSLLYPTDGPNDGVVSAQSGIGHVPLLGSPVPVNWLHSNPPVTQYVTDEAHFAFIGPAYYERRSLADGGTEQERSQSYNCLRHLMQMAGESTSSAPPTPCRAPDLVRAAAAEPTLQTTADLTGTIVAGATVTHTVMVDENKGALFSLFWTPGPLGVTLVAPDGTVITPTVALESQGTITYTPPVTTTDFLQTAGYAFAAATPGAWQLRIHRPEQSGAVDSTPIRYVGFVSLDSPFALTVTRDAQSYAPGATATFTAALTADVTVPTEGITVSALLYLPDGGLQRLAWQSIDGSRFRAEYTVPQGGGSVVMTTVALGEREEITFSRQVESLWQITPDSATFGVDIVDEAIDLNDNGLSDYLVVQVPISVSVPATYTLHAGLTTSDTIIASAVAVISVTTPGRVVATLRFAGRDIATAGIDGPYQLRNVVLLNPALGDLPIRRETYLYTTAAYEARQFEQEMTEEVTQEVYLPLVLR